LSKPQAFIDPEALLENDASAELEPPALQPASAATDAVTTIARRALCLDFIVFPFDQVMIGDVAATSNPDMSTGTGIGATPCKLVQHRSPHKGLANVLEPTVPEPLSALSCGRSSG
jgi:hypothetical protein